MTQTNNVRSSFVFCDASVLQPSPPVAQHDYASHEGAFALVPKNKCTLGPRYDDKMFLIGSIDAPSSFSTFAILHLFIRNNMRKQNLQQASTHVTRRQGLQLMMMMPSMTCNEVISEHGHAGCQKRQRATA